MIFSHKILVPVCLIFSILLWGIYIDPLSLLILKKPCLVGLQQGSLSLGLFGISLGLLIPERSRKVGYGVLILTLGVSFYQLIWSSEVGLKLYHDWTLYTLREVTNPLKKSLSYFYEGARIFKTLNTQDPWWQAHLILLGLVVFYSALLFNLREMIFKKKESQDTFGSAAIADDQDLQRLKASSGIAVGCHHKMNLSPRLFVEHLKKSRCTGHLIKLNPLHTILIAPSGAGKGVGIVIPTLLDYEGPVVVVDVKDGENFHVTSRHRGRTGRLQYRFDPFNAQEKASEKINFLELLDQESEKLVDDVKALVGCFFEASSTGTGTDKHFKEMGSSLLQCLILYVLGSSRFEKKEKTFSTVLSLLCDETPQEVFTDIAEAEDLYDGLPSQLAKQVLSTTGPELSGILNTGRRQLEAFASPLLKKATSQTTIDFNKIISNEADLYVTIPADFLATHDKIIRLLLESLFMKIINSKERKEKDILFVMDEMPSYGRIEKLASILMIGRAYQVRLLAISQTVEALKSAYASCWETFLASSLKLFLGVSDVQTARYVSDMFGAETIETTSSNKGTNVNERQKSSSEGESTGSSSRALFTADEIMRFGNQVVCAFMPGEKPLLLRKIEYFKHKAYKGKFGKNPLEARPQGKRKSFSGIFSKFKKERAISS